MALVFDRNPEFPVDPWFSSFGLKRKRKGGRPKNIGMALDSAVPRVADQREEIEKGEHPRGEVGLYIAPMHHVLFGQYDSPVSEIAPCLQCKFCSRHWAIIWGKLQI